MTKWEYKIIVFEDEYPMKSDDDLVEEDEEGAPILIPSWEEQLNQLGQDGWELVSMIKSKYKGRVAATLKRQVSRD